MKLKKTWDYYLSICDFTDKEKIVISYLRRGWYQEDIAAELYVCRRTISRYVKNIKKKIEEVQ